MKTILSGAVAAIALVGIAAPAAAQTAELHYAGGIVSPLTNPTGLGLLGAAANEGAILAGIGTRYTALGGSLSGDTTPATTRVDVEFTLKGKVNKDCSFYAGNTASARTIDLGVIGVQTGNNVNVQSAFEMVAPAGALIDTLTAGCNTNNVVEINKNDIRGLVNNNPGGYDTNQFQANIPYSVEASWNGVALNAQTTGTTQSLTVDTASNAAQKQQGAWRSAMSIDIVVPTVTNKGLVAGNYEGKTTITLRAI
ncbi:hypothetical protein KK137_15615 [Croceibacterium sp. LX-88]|uniref:Uncharacterized protein n=1 Tax=Croceibacterium selenioxidans TaxID=2838833 RepID=A0ABS5W8B8_9SPHN|nr:hypothetical protein [Croceibacterium selenioxidans]MBT2135766.1 hypothetical protein [Croceibacterium selenioxidans]